MANNTVQDQACLKDVLRPGEGADVAAEGFREHGPVAAWRAAPLFVTLALLPSPVALPSPLFNFSAPLSADVGGLPCFLFFPLPPLTVSIEVPMSVLAAVVVALTSKPSLKALTRLGLGLLVAHLEQPAIAFDPPQEPSTAIPHDQYYRTRHPWFLATLGHQVRRLKIPDESAEAAIAHLGIGPSSPST
eukprot:CAMPEP_0196205588 /NCGR_PEP_ID=MMETSP0912-20130531/7277_1 /TAXON_ID=49265 /ORGANISM="Thalassiosira rotula, Strain GSO102" /LENGTH=188 /DNA_ID=CAMNT_0041479991 /DNA_START=621 /DNA_END=1181 /DNA_ORIENTATION=-